MNYCSLGVFQTLDFLQRELDSFPFLEFSSLPHSVTPDHEYSVNNLLYPALRENSLTSCLQNGTASLGLPKARMSDNLLHFPSSLLWLSVTNVLVVYINRIDMPPKCYVVKEEGKKAPSINQNWFLLSLYEIYTTVKKPSAKFPPLTV